jgi:hypothetical protein
LEILEKVNTFAYLGCKISYEEKKNIAKKISIFIKIFGILKNVLKLMISMESIQYFSCPIILIWL